MISIEIEQLKTFTEHLFIQNTFDTFLVSEVSITTFAEFNINGRLKRDYYSDEEVEIAEQYDFARWSDIKPVCYSIIKGNRLPSCFRITLHLPPKSITKLLENADTNITPDHINSLALNIRYENNKITCITGTSLSIFTLDKSVDTVWDNYISKSLNNLFG